MLFSNVLILGLGAGLLTIPVVLHFAMQAKPKPLPFPAFHFLRESQAASSRRIRIRHWLLLAARMLLVALPALALAGPSVAENSLAAWYNTGIAALLSSVLGIAAVAAWLRRSHTALTGVLAVLFLAALGWCLYQFWNALQPEGGKTIGRAEEPVTAVLIVDTSPRMTYRRENQSHLDFAIERGSWILGELPRDSQISVIDTSDPEPFYSVDSGSAERRLKALEVSFLQNSLPEAMRAAFKLLEKAEYPRREIYVLTDLSAAAWDRASDLPDLIQRSGAGLFVFDVGTPQPANLRLNNLTAESVQLSGTSALALQASLNAIGSGGERVLEMKIEQPDPARPVLRDGKILTPDRFWTIQQPVEVPDDGAVDAVLRFEQELPPGVHHGTIQVLGSDGLILDNQRYFTVAVEQQWKVLVLHGPAVNPANVTETLAPPGYTNYQLTAAGQRELNTLDLGQFNAVFLLDPAPMAENDWERLATYVRQGGGLGFFPGAGALNNGLPDPSFLVESAQQLIGGKMTVPVRRPDGDLFLSPENLSHAVFAGIRPVESSVAWNRFPVRLYWGLETAFSDQQPGQVVLRYSNGDPALVERNLGLGRCLSMTTPVTEPSAPEGRKAWNSLFLGSPVPAWLLVRGIAQYLVQSRSETLNLLTGQTATLKNDPRVHPEAYTLFTPDPERPPAPIQASRGEIRFAFTQTPGQYRLKGTREGPVQRGFSVNMEDAASDLRRATPEQLDSWLGADRYKLARETDEFERQQGTSRRGQEFYPLLLVVMAFILGVETLVSNRFYGARPSRTEGPALASAGLRTRAIGKSDPA